MSHLTLEASRNGRANLFIVRAVLGDQAVAVDEVKLLSAEHRARFVRHLMEKLPDQDAQAIDDELLRMASRAAAVPEAPTTDPSEPAELDTSRIVRPERIIRPELSAVAVPTMTAMGDRPVGRWTWYIRWADGRRERRPLAPTIDLPDRSRLWVHPTPMEPGPATPAGWSADARRRWLAGEPAPDPAAVFARVAERLGFFLDLPPDQGPGIVATLTLWVMLTYIYQVWDATPYLFVGGPAHSGKSRVGELLARLVWRPTTTSNTTGPAIFRTLHDGGNTFLLDEAERLRSVHDPATAEILSMLLAGYKRGGQATRLEPVGDGFRPVAYDVFTPKALICIAGLPPALASRCIPLTMVRADAASDKPRRRIDAAPAAWQALRDDLHALALEHGPEWLSLPGRGGVCPPMSGRDYELWSPILALAAWLEGHGADGLLPIMQTHAQATIDAAQEDQVSDADEVLLRLLAERRAALETPQARDLLRAAQELEPATFRTWSAKGVGNALRRYGVQTAMLHGRRVYRTDLPELAALGRRYGLTLGIDADSQPHGDTGV